MGNQGQGNQSNQSSSQSSSSSTSQSQPDITTGTVLITESETANSKYLLISVPDFATDPSGVPGAKDADGNVTGDRKGQQMTSYLRLGVPKSTADIGDDLIAHAYAVGAVGFTGTVKLDGVTDPVGVPFVDDERNRGGVTPGGEMVEPLVAAGHGMTVEERYNLHTKHMTSKGGWRDHSDGNRISTTYGDKIEVVRGNYKLVVMGRQNDPGNSQGHEWCGNHVQDWGQGTMPGASTTLEWIQNAYVPRIGSPNVVTRSVTTGTGTTKDFGVIVTKAEVKADTAKGIKAEPEEVFRGGVWLLINSTERVYQYSRNAGNFRTQQWGEMLESYVGSENPEHVGTTDGAGYQGHPTKDDHKSYHTVASGNSAVPTEDAPQRTISEELAERLSPSSVGIPRGNPHIINKTWATRIDNYTGTSGHNIPKIYEETWADDVESKENVTTKKEDSTVGTSTSTSKVGALTETTVVGTQVSTTTAGAIVDTTFYGVKNETSIGGPSNEITVAAATSEIKLAIGSSEITVVPFQFELELCASKRVVTVAKGLEFKIGDVEDVYAAAKKKVTLDETMANLKKLETCLTSSKVDMTHKHMALMMDLKALALNLGA